MWQAGLSVPPPKLCCQLWGEGGTPAVCRPAHAARTCATATETRAATGCSCSCCRGLAGACWAAAGGGAPAAGRPSPRPASPSSAAGRLPSSCSLAPHPAVKDPQVPRKVGKQLVQGWGGAILCRRFCLHRISCGAILLQRTALAGERKHAPGGGLPLAPPR